MPFWKCFLKRLVVVLLIPFWYATFAHTQSSCSPYVPQCILPSYKHAVLKSVCPNTFLCRRRACNICCLCVCVYVYLYVWVLRVLGCCRFLSAQPTHSQTANVFLSNPICVHWTTLKASKQWVLERKEHFNFFSRFF